MPKKSIYVSPDLNISMKGLDLNWSEIAQKAFIEAIEKHEKEGLSFGPYKKVVRDHKRFKKLFPEPRAIVHPDYDEPLDATPIRTLISERINGNVKG